MTEESQEDVNSERSIEKVTELINGRIKNIVSSVSEEHFTSTLSTALRGNISEGKKVYVAFTCQLQNVLENTWADVCEKRNLEAKLDVLNDAISRQQSTGLSRKCKISDIKRQQLLQRKMKEMKAYRDALEKELHDSNMICEELKAEIEENNAYTNKILSKKEQFDKNLAEIVANSNSYKE